MNILLLLVGILLLITIIGLLTANVVNLVKAKRYTRAMKILELMSEEDFEEVYEFAKGMDIDFVAEYIIRKYGGKYGKC